MLPVVVQQIFLWTQDAAVDSTAVFKGKTAGAAGGKRKRHAERAYVIDLFLDVRFNEVTGQREYLAEWAP